jgi:hypothetical protein
MSFFTILMFLLGARLFLGGVDDLHRLITGKPQVINLDSIHDPQQEALLRAQVVLDNQLFRYKPRVMAAQTAARLILALAYLFAVAAVVSRDTRGRRVCMLAGWLGLASSMGNAVFLGLWVSKNLPWVLPHVTQALSEDALRAGRPVPTAEMVAEQAHLFLVDGPVAACGLGMVLSLILLAYFAGRRMRRFYDESGQSHG